MTLQLTKKLGPLFMLEWDRPSRTVLVWRDEEVVATIPNVGEPTWRTMIQDDYQGLG